MTKEGIPEGRGPIARETNRWLLELLACPECLASVQETGAILTCSACGREYSIVDGVPQLLPSALTGGGPTGPAWQVWARALDRLVAWRRRTWNGGVEATALQRTVRGIQAEFATHCRLAEARGTVLDVGCGSADIVATLPSECRYTGVDPLPLAGPDRPPMVRGVGERLPFRGEAFDWVLILETLDHCQSPHTTMGEILRVLKPDGTLCVQQYVSPLGWGGRLSRWWRRPAEPGRPAPMDSLKVTLLDASDVRRLLEAAFADVKVGWAGEGSHLFLAAHGKRQVGLRPWDDGDARERDHSNIQPS